MDNNDNKAIFLNEFLYQTIDGVFTGRDKDILLRRFGLAGYDCQSLGKVGRAHKISRERVRQIEKNILNHLRASWKTTIKLPSHNLAAVKFKETLDALLMAGGNTIISGEEVFNGKSLPNGRKKRMKEIKLKRKAQRRYGRFLRHFIWPQNISLDCMNIIAQYPTRVREVDPDNVGNSGSYFSKKLKSHVSYESGLEREFLWACEEFNEVVYYKEQPLILEYEYLGHKRKYFPDFLVVFKDGRGALCEIKGTLNMVLYESMCKYEALKKYCEKNGLGYCMTDGRKEFEYYKTRVTLPINIEDAFITALGSGPLNWKSFKEIRRKVNFSQANLMALILKHKLIWEVSPFSLYRR